MAQDRDIERLTAESIQLLKEMIAIPSPSFREDEVCSHICRWMESKGIVFERIGNNIVATLSSQPSFHRGHGAGTGYGNFPLHNTTAASPQALMLCAHIDTVAASEDYAFDPYTPDYTQAAAIIEQKLNCITYAESASGKNACKKTITEGEGANGNEVERSGANKEDRVRKIGPEDIVAGLGSNDDGASAVAMIAVFRYLAGKTQGTAREVILVLSCEEERSGQGGMSRIWPELLKDKVGLAIVGEPTCMKAATAERGLLVIDAEARGVSGHAARNEGVNALYIALEDIVTLRNHVFERISPRMGKVNLNVTQINAGTAHNVIPDRCSFTIDIRPTERYTNEEILDELESLCRSTLTARNLRNRSSATAECSPLQRAAESLGIETFSSPTTSDWMRITCDAIKMGPGDSSRSHKKDEFVLVSEIKDGIRTYIDFINCIDEK